MFFIQSRRDSRWPRSGYSNPMSRPKVQLLYSPSISNTFSILWFHRLSLLQGSPPARIISHADHASVSGLLELFLASFKGQKQQQPDLASTLIPRAFHMPTSRSQNPHKGTIKGPFARGGGPLGPHEEMISGRAESCDWCKGDESRRNKLRMPGGSVNRWVTCKGRR